MYQTAILLIGWLAFAASAVAADQYQSRIDEAERNLATIDRELYDKVHDPLDAFMRGPRGDCASKSLNDAGAAAITIGVLTAQMGGDLSDQQQSAGWILGVADGASEHGCPDLARKLYRHVIERYIGFGYAAHRQRAEIGLADLRGSN